MSRIIQRSFHYRIIRSERTRGLKWETIETIVASGLRWNTAKETRDRLQRAIAEANPSQSTWTLPVLYCEPEPQLEFEFA